MCYMLWQFCLSPSVCHSGVLCQTTEQVQIIKKYFDYWYHFETTTAECSRCRARQRIIIIMIIIIIIIIVIARVHPVHLMNVQQHKVAANPQNKPTNLGCDLACSERQRNSSNFLHLPLAPTFRKLQFLANIWLHVRNDTNLTVDCVGDGANVDTCSSSSLATAAATDSSGQLFMMNLLVHSLMDDATGLESALESTLRRQVQVLLPVFRTNEW